LQKLCLLILISLCCACAQKAPTFSADIAPLAFEKCTPCHRPGQIGKFNLITPDDFRINKDKILFAIREKLMPPWPADPHYSNFVGENYLNEKEIERIEEWYALEMPIGDSSEIPEMPKFHKSSLIGVPDLTVPIKPYLVKGDYSDRFLVIKVPFELPRDTFIRALEFVPGNSKLVHHVNGDMVLFEEGKKKDLYDGSWIDDLKWDSTQRQVYKNIGVLHDDGSFPLKLSSVVNYLPGVIATKYPEGIGGWRVNKKSAFLLNDLHYGPYYDNVWDSSYINIFYAKDIPKRPVQEFTMGSLGQSPVVPELIIAPNTEKKVMTELKIPEKISVLTINPHMHLLGKDFWAYAVPPSGDTIPLIKIDRWDFNWQYFYTFKKAVVIPSGSTIYAHGTYDNTSKNPYNPNSPPRVVKDNNGSMRTTDEMFQFIVSYLPYQEGDEDLSLE